MSAAAVSNVRPRTARSATAAVSVLRILGPSEKPAKPFLSRRSSSPSVHPPSGPIARRSLRPGAGNAAPPLECGCATMRGPRGNMPSSSPSRKRLKFRRVTTCGRMLVPACISPSTRRGLRFSSLRSVAPQKSFSTFFAPTRIILPTPIAASCGRRRFIALGRGGARIRSTHGFALSVSCETLATTRGSSPGSDVAMISEQPSGPSIVPVFILPPISAWRMSRTCAALAPPNSTTPSRISLFSNSILFICAF